MPRLEFSNNGDNLDSQRPRARPRSNREIRDELASSSADDQVEEMLYGNPCCSLKKTVSLLIKLTVTIVILGITGLLLFIFNTNHPIAQKVVMFIIRNPEAAPFILIGINILITLFFLPGVFGALLSGYGFCFITHYMPLALLGGTACCFIGFSIGSVMALYLGRYLFANYLRKLQEKNKYLYSFSLCFEKKGLKILLLLRLSPLVPYNLLNYVMGIYPVKLWQYCLANFGMVPGIIVYVYIGVSASSMGALFDSASGGGLVKIIMLALGLLFAIAAVVVICIYTKKELNKALRERQEGEEVDEEGEGEGDVVEQVVDEENEQDSHSRSPIDFYNGLPPDSSLTRPGSIKKSAPKLNVVSSDENFERMSKSKGQISSGSFEMPRNSNSGELRGRSTNSQHLNSR